MPLRPELYRRLCARANAYRFGPVKIANEDQEMVGSIETDAGTKKSRLNIKIRGECYVVNCPFCSDTRGRLSISYRWALFDAGTNSRNLWLCKCFNANCVNSHERRLALYNMVFDDLNNGRQPSDDLVLKGSRPPLPSMPKTAGEIIPLHELPHDHAALAYPQSRAFDPDQLSRQLQVGFCIEASPEFPLARNRIIIPVYLNGTLAGWQARCVGTPPPGHPKYYTMRGMRTGELLYNYDIARRHPFVVICEGCTDVWRVGPPALALFNKVASSFQMQLLTATWRTGTVVVLLDGDAFAEAQQLYQSLAGQVRNRVLVTLPEDNDPDEFDHGPLWQYIAATAHEQGVTLPIGASASRGG